MSWYMTDTGRTNSILTYFLNLSGSLPTQPTGLRLRLIKTQGAGNGNVNGSNGTELTSGNDPGYTAPSTVAITFGAASSAVCTSTNQQQWTATGTWTDGVAGAEIWDIAGTPLRWFGGALSTAISASTVINGDTVTFASGAVSVSGVAW